MSTKCSYKFKKIFNYTRSISEFLGCDIIVDNFKMSWRTFALIALINLVLSSTFYQNYVEVYGNGNLTVLLMSTSTIGTGIKVCEQKILKYNKT